MITEPIYNNIGLKGGNKPPSSSNQTLMESIKVVIPAIISDIKTKGNKSDDEVIKQILGVLSSSSINVDKSDLITNLIALIDYHKKKPKDRTTNNNIAATAVVASLNNILAKNPEIINGISEADTQKLSDLIAVTYSSSQSSNSPQSNNHVNNNSTTIDIKNKITLFDKTKFLFSKFFRTSVFLFFFFIIFKIIDKILLFFNFNTTTNKTYLFWYTFLFFLFALLPIKKSYL